MINKAKLVVLISGHGSNLQAILDACKTGHLSAEVVAVMADQPDVFGLERARQHNIPAVTKIKTLAQSRVDYDRELADLVINYQPDWIILAGWMRLLSAAFLNRFPNKIVNLHPALPSMFPGTHAVERAFKAYQQGEINQTGVMVHLVPDEGIDSGPVLGQITVPIYPDDDLEKLAARVHESEHKLLINTLQNLLPSMRLNTHTK